jgi:hypothetical protein
MSATQTSSPAGWYRDPTGHSTLRYWSGTQWTTWVNDSSGTHPDPLRLGHRLEPGDVEHLTFIHRVFLPEARRMGYLSPREDTRLEGLVTTMRTEAEKSGGTVPAALPTTAHTALPRPAVPDTVPRVTVRTAPATLPAEPRRAAHRDAAPEPSPAARWWRRTRTAVGSDLAVHGLAYVGVLLFFIGAFGLVVFAFGDVAPSLRPLAEVVIALVPFGAAALLMYRGAAVVGRALEVAGGLVLPVMVVTSFLDGVGTPPDLEGTGLVLALTSLLALVALGYALWAARHPDSALRYLVAPVAWLAVAMASLGLGPRDVPSGKGVATPSSWQTAAVMLAVVVSLALCRRWPDARLAAATRVSAVPGLGVVALLALLSWTAEDWPPAPALATGALVLVGLDLLGDRLPVTLPGVVGPLWWALVTAGTALGVVATGSPADVAPVAVIAVAGFLAQLERSAALQRPAATLVLPAAGAFLAVLSTAVDPWWAVATCSALTVWAGVRRAAPPAALVRAAIGLDVVAAVAPVLAVVALAEATSATTALAAAAGLTVPAALAPRVVAVGRGPALWTHWARAVGAAVLVAAGAGLAVAGDLNVGEQWTVVGALAVVTATALVVRLAPVARPPAVGAAASMTAVWLMVTLDVPVLAGVAVLGGLALALVVAAHTRVVPQGPGVAASVGLTGHALGVLVLVLATPDGWSPVLAVALATTGVGVTGWLGAVGRSPVGAALDQRRIGWLPLALTATGLPVTAALGLDRLQVLALGDQWRVLVPAGAAIAYALLTRVPVPTRVGLVAAWSAWAAALLAPFAATDDLTAGVGLAVVPVAVVLVRTARRHTVMTWSAVLAVAPAVGLFAHAASTWVAGRSDELVIAMALLVVGGALLVGGSAADLRGRPWVPRWRPAHAWALPPVAVGLAEVAVALVVSVSLTATEAGWVCAGAAAILVATAVLARVGLLAGPAAAIGWVSFVLLAPEPVGSAPWAHVGLGVVLCASAELLTRWGDRTPWWARADVPLLVSAALPAVAALVVSVDTTDQHATFAAVGALCLAVGGRLRRFVVAAATLDGLGVVLVLTGAAGAGPGWLALALAALAVGLTALAVISDGAVRTIAQLGGALAAAGSWGATVDWLALSQQGALDATVAGAGVVTVVAAGAALRRLVDRSWVLAWGGTATVLAALGGVVAVASERSPLIDAAPSWWVTAGLAAVAAALGLAAGPVAVPVLREAAALAALEALAVGLQAADAGVAVHVILLAAVSTVSALTLLALHTSGRSARWTTSILVFGGAAAVWCVVVAAIAPAEPLLLVPALGAAAVQSAAAGVVVDDVLLRMGAPLLACGAWLVFALEALDGNPQWVTVPVGLAVLAVVGLWRADRRQAGLDLAPPAVVALEAVGIAFLVGSSLVQAFTVGSAYAALVSAIGLLVASWGGITQVRRRLVTGAVLVVLGLVILVAVPLVQLLPAWEGATLWLLVGGLGVALVLLATMLERGRAAVRAGTRRLREVTEGWE